MDTKTCVTCGQPFRRSPNTSRKQFAGQQFCSLTCRRRKAPKAKAARSQGGGVRGARLGQSVISLRLAPPERYAGPLTRDLWTLAVAELRDVRETIAIVQAKGGGVGGLRRHEARLSAVVARGWEVRV